MKPHCRRVVGLLAVAAAWGGCAAQAGSPADPKGSGAFEIQWGELPIASLRTHVPPGRSTQWCGPLHKQDVVSWDFRSAEPLEMSVQSQEGRNVSYSVRMNAVTTASGVLRPAAAQNYCWTWTNSTTSPVALQARLRRGVRKN